MMADPIVTQSSDSATVTLPPGLTQLGHDLYTELRRRWIAGGRKPFLAPHRELAALLGCSAGAIGRHMQFFDDEALIRRAPYRNKYLITLPDTPTRFGVAHESTRDRSESSGDRSPVDSSPAVAPPITPDRADAAPGRGEPDPGAGDRSDSIPPDPPMVHVSMQQQQQPSESWAGREGDQAALRAELANDDAAVVTELFRRHPTLTLTEFAREVVAAESRPNVFCPRAVALKALSSGERVRGARDRPSLAAPADPPPERPPRRPKDRWAEDRPDALSAEWRRWQTEQEQRDRRYAARVAGEGSYAATS